MAHPSPLIPAATAEPPLVLTLDIGTSAARAVLVDRLGRLVAGVEARRAHQLHTSVAGAAESDADALLELTLSCIDQALAQAGELANAIAGVAVCTFVGNLLGVSAAGRPVTPLITYADTRSAGEIAGLRADFDETITHDITGCHFHTSYWPAQLRWYAHTAGQVFRQVAQWITIGEYLELQLFGAAAVSFSAAAWSGLLERRRLVWHEPLLRGLPMGLENLGPLVDANMPRSGLRRVYAARWPALADIPWFPAIGDGAAANIGSGCISPAQVALTIGTTSAVRLVTAEDPAVIPWGLWCYRVDGQRSLPGGALSEGGNIFGWMHESLRLDVADLDAALAAMPPDAHGLTILPFFAGERSPGWAAEARATLHGLSLATTPLDILRAGLEAVGYRVALIFDLLGALLPTDAAVIVSGGAILRAPAWLQIMADILGRPITASAVVEASARGAALLALEALGALPALAEAPVFLGETYAPRLEHTERYRAARQRQQGLYVRIMGKG